MLATVRFLRGLVLVALAGSVTPAHALMIQGTATADAGVFHYAVSMVDNTLDNLTFVTFLDAPLADPSIAGSLVAPAGFQASYDSILGLLDFFADLGFSFDKPNTRPFTFDSLADPSSAFTSAQGLDDFLNPVPVDAVNITLVGNGRVPVPGGLPLLGLGVGLLAICRRQAPAAPGTHGHQVTAGHRPNRRGRRQT